MMSQIAMEMEIIIARTIAQTAHWGQRCKFGGEPFITHPEAVASYVPERFKAVAWLHDVLEDTSLTPDFLRDAGITEPTIESVLILTRLPTERTYWEYIDHVIHSGNEAAMVVKLADATHNLRPSCPPKLMQRYNGVVTMMRDALKMFR